MPATPDSKLKAFRPRATDRRAPEGFPVVIGLAFIAGMVFAIIVAAALGWWV